MDTGHIFTEHGQTYIEVLRRKATTDPVNQINSSISQSNTNGNGISSQATVNNIQYIYSNFQNSLASNKYLNPAVSYNNIHQFQSPQQQQPTYVQNSNNTQSTAFSQLPTTVCQTSSNMPPNQMQPFPNIPNSHPSINNGAPALGNVTASGFSALQNLGIPSPISNPEIQNSSVMPQILPQSTLASKPDRDIKYANLNFI